jgi:hypothetical protein
VTDLAAFLTARLNAEEALARGATQFNSADWTCPTTGVISFGPPDDEWSALGDRDLTEHIATWDPARVLAEIAAKRVVLDAHTKLTGAVSGDTWCTCQDLHETWPCITLRALATVWNAHEDFDESWRT